MVTPGTERKPERTANDWGQFFGGGVNWLFFQRGLLSHSWSYVWCINCLLSSSLMRFVVWTASDPLPTHPTKSTCTLHKRMSCLTWSRDAARPRREDSTLVLTVTWWFQFSPPMQNSFRKREALTSKPENAIKFIIFLNLKHSPENLLSISLKKKTKLHCFFCAGIENSPFLLTRKNQLG